MESHKVLMKVVVLTYLFSSVYALQIELYSEKDRRGQSIKIDVSDNDCSELPEAWHNGVASVDTLGNCVQFYDEPKCKGSMTVIQPFHIIHQMDLSLINYAFRLRTASPCGPKVKNGRYVIQNAADASVMAALSKHGNFARIWTVNTTKESAVPKTQQWEVVEKGDTEYFLKPRENSDNYPVSFDEMSLKKGAIKRKAWKIMSVGRGRYIIKDSTNQRCLYMTNDHKVEEHSCRIWSTNQEWVFRTIIGDPLAEKSKKAEVGNGLNFNILSKVGTARPATKPPPQFYPIYYNATKLANIKKFSTAAPYVIRKKIKRGPRPKTKYVDEPFLDLRPPGLRPAIGKQISNNNNFLLFKPPNGEAKDSFLPEFVPTDDLELLPTKEMLKSSPQYKEYMDIVKQFLTEQYIKTPHGQQKLHQIQLQFIEHTKQKKKGEKDDDENKGDEEDDEDSTDEEEADDDESSDSHGKRKKKKNPRPPPPPLTEDQPGFMHQVFSRFKSNLAFMVPTVQIPKIPKIPNVLPSLPSFPSIPVPKISLTFTKSGGEEKESEKSKSSQKGIGGTSSSGYTYSFSKNGKNYNQFTSSEEHHPKHTYPRGVGRFFTKQTTTTSQKPLTLGSWGIFG